MVRFALIRSRRLKTSFNDLALFEHPYIQIGQLADTLSVTFPTASKALANLHGLGILSKCRLSLDPAYTASRSFLRFWNGILL